MRALRLTLRQLQIFRAVADSGSTRAAAEAIALSQSAASAAINELERTLGLQLFDRIGKHLQLNDNGRALMPRALEVLEGAGGIERWALDGPAQIGALRIGASTTIGNYLLPSILSDFRAALPASARGDWHVQVAIANTAAIVDQVAELRLDMGLIEGPCHRPELWVRPWLEDDMVLVAAADDPIRARGRRGRVTLEALAQATWLLREVGSGTREIVEQWLMPHVPQLRASIELGNPEAIKRAAAAGLGIACLSRFVVADLLQSGALVALTTPLPALRRRLYCVMHTRKHHTHGLTLLMAHLQAMRAPERARTGTSA